MNAIATIFLVTTALIYGVVLEAPEAILKLFHPESVLFSFIVLFLYLIILYLATLFLLFCWPSRHRGVRHCQRVYSRKYVSGSATYTCGSSDHESSSNASENDFNRDSQRCNTFDRNIFSAKSSRQPYESSDIDETSSSLSEYKRRSSVGSGYSTPDETRFHRRKRRKSRFSRKRGVNALQQDTLRQTSQRYDNQSLIDSDERVYLAQCSTAQATAEGCPPRYTRNHLTASSSVFEEVVRREEYPPRSPPDGL